MVDVRPNFFDSGSSKFSDIWMYDFESLKSSNVLDDLFGCLIDGTERVVNVAFHSVKYT